MRTFVAILTLFTAGAAFSQGVRVQGVGTFSCGKYIQLRAEQNNAQDSAFISWVWGYVSGFNMEAKAPTSRETPDGPSTLAYIDKYCRENPLDNVLFATNALIRDLGGKRNPF